MDSTSFITTSDGHGQAVLKQRDVIMLIMTYVNWKFMVFILRMSIFFGILQLAQSSLIKLVKSSRSGNFYFILGNENSGDSPKSELILPCNSICMFFHSVISQ